MLSTVPCNTYALSSCDMTRTAPPTISLEDHTWNVPYDNQTHQSGRAGKNAYGPTNWMHNYLRCQLTPKPHIESEHSLQNREQYFHGINCLLTEWGRAGQEIFDIRSERENLAAHGPSGPDLESDMILSGPPSQSISTLYESIVAGYFHVSCLNFYVVSLRSSPKMSIGTTTLN